MHSSDFQQLFWLEISHYWSFFDKKKLRRGCFKSKSSFDFETSKYLAFLENEKRCKKSWDNKIVSWRNFCEKTSLIIFKLTLFSLKTLLFYFRI